MKSSFHSSGTSAAQQPVLKSGVVTMKEKVYRGWAKYIGKLCSHTCQLEMKWISALRDSGPLFRTSLLSVHPYSTLSPP